MIRHNLMRIIANHQKNNQGHPPQCKKTLEKKDKQKKKPYRYGCRTVLRSVELSVAEAMRSYMHSEYVGP
jgi:hypothetical protein